MNTHVVLLLNSDQFAEDVLAKRQVLSRSGYELAGIVDPSQKDPVVSKSGIPVTNSIPMAAEICRTAIFLYGDTILHTNAMEVPRWQTSEH
ncbi:hypothetical protein ROLI_010140 [Roseobacter fucihabitans]|uniref:Uncharacterized protein n=1 Tax=Roseobacter fucihabitans TaxID=1537242 RepID=A0ABZ2BPM2_9RHOB|nr:hypothetical protein [Roseobacter litoralis]MBC6965358.1 hypothetical protein [Roseobacter litoralis]MBC6965476.1 hypothetical protein [Roseobacter litoralis]